MHNTKFKGTESSFSMRMTHTMCVITSHAVSVFVCERDSAPWACVSVCWFVCCPVCLHVCLILSVSMGHCVCSKAHMSTCLGAYICTCVDVPMNHKTLILVPLMPQRQNQWGIGGRRG